MKFLYYLIEIPLIFAAVWLVANAYTESEIFTFELWPLQSEIQVNEKLALCFFMLFGFIWAKINSWFAYSPLRRALRSQKKANRVLNKEQEKLNETVTGLQKNIVGLQEKAKEQAEKAKAQALEFARNNPKPEIKQKFSAMWAKIKNAFRRKKED